MELYFLRHGIAVDRGTPGYEDDRMRPLTREGKKKLQAIAQSMKQREISFDVVLASPYERAKQTAVIVSEILDLNDRMHLVDALAPDGDYDVMLDLIRERYADAGRIVLVGHEPYLSGLIARLLRGECNIDITLKKGGLCKLNIDTPGDDGRASLEWLLTPKWMMGTKTKG